MSSTDHRPGRVLDLTAERARRAKAQADEREPESPPGELLTAAQIEQTVIANVDQIRSRLMTEVSLVAPYLVRIETATEAHQILASAIFTALERVAADAREAAAEEPGGNPADDPETA